MANQRTVILLPLQPCNRIFLLFASFIISNNTDRLVSIRTPPSDNMIFDSLLAGTTEPSIVIDRTSSFSTDIWLAITAPLRNCGYRGTTHFLIPIFLLNSNILSNRNSRKAAIRYKDKSNTIKNNSKLAIVI